MEKAAIGRASLKQDRGYMLTILFFGQLRERLNTSRLEIEYHAQDHAINTVEKLTLLLQEKSTEWHENLTSGKVLVAVNQEISHADAVLKDNDEVAFFPPVTGG